MHNNNIHSDKIKLHRLSMQLYFAGDVGRYGKKKKERFTWIAAILISMFAVIFFGRLTYLGITNGFWQRIFLEHFAAVVGLPAAAIASLFIVIILEASSGNIEFKGASGPIIMWVVCFLSIVLAIKALW